MVQYRAAASPHAVSQLQIHKQGLYHRCETNALVALGTG